MPILQLIVLAIVQGLTEFIPVSSSAHLILVPQLIEGWADQGRGIDVAAHVGSLGAVLIYFRQETGSLVKGGVDTLRFHPSEDRRLFLFIAAATLPLVMMGLALAKIDVAGLSLADHLRSPFVIAAASIFFGIILWLSDRRPTSTEEMPSTWKAVMTVGFAQALATIPGTSRSGITMTAARFMGYSREYAAKFSMLLAIPAILASGAYEGLGMLEEGSGTTLTAALATVALSFLTAWAAIAVFMKMTRRMDFTPFVIYRIALGVALIVIFM